MFNVSTGAPRVFAGKVIIGNSGADFGARGFVTAYDQVTGKQLWRFFTVPGSPEQNQGDPAMERAAATWSGKYWKRSEEHTSELQSLMRISYAVFCLKKKNKKKNKKRQVTRTEA